MKRKDLKKKGHKTLKKHYWLLVLVCIIASFLGTEFNSSLSLTKLKTNIIKQEESLKEDIVNRDIKEAKQHVHKEINEVKRTKKRKDLKKTGGVIGYVLNLMSSGSLYVTLIESINSIVHSTNISIIVLIALTFILSFIIWYFIINIYTVISRRIFLESRIYKKVHLEKFIFLLRIKKWIKACFTMFLVYLYECLWTLTIIGGIIKRYSYYLVPYIVAENPDIKANTAIRLSQDIMNGHKWECFKLELSFILWELLGILTIGISKIFYSNPYKLAVFSEYYVKLRKEAINNKIKNVDYLNDKYLYEKADKEVIENKYADIIKLSKEKDIELEKEVGIKGFFAKYFGVTTYKEKHEEKYIKQEIKHIKIDTYDDIIKGKSYPNRLYPIPERKKLKRVEYSNYLRRYNIFSLILMFFIFCFIGWMWEVGLYLISTGRFVNRGVSHGPWLPIYGIGGLLILTLLYRLRKKPIKHFFATVLICGTVEYLTSVILEFTHNGQKWWDYSNYVLNLNGRICFEGLLVFGLGGFIITYLGAPLFDNIIKLIPKNKLIIICTVLLCLFGIDEIYSSKVPNIGRGITNYIIR